MDLVACTGPGKRIRLLRQNPIELKLSFKTQVRSERGAFSLAVF